MANYDDTATVSGSVVSIDNGADEVGTKSCVVTVRPTLTGTSEVVEKQTGRNLLNYADVTNSYRITSLTDNGDGSFTAVASGAVAYIDHIISVKAGQEYSIKCKSATNDEGNASQIGAVNVYDGSDDTATLLLNGASIQTRKGFTPTGNYILVRNKVSGGYGAGTGTIVEPQLELGSSATAYEPYITPTTYTASLGLTIYGGEVDIVNGEGQETHGKKVFDGTEGTGGTPSWTMISVTQGTMFRITVSDKSTTSATNTLCSYYTPVAQAQRADGTVSGAGTNVDIIDNRFSSVDAFKAWLSENPVTLVYELATPTDFTFTGQEIPTRLGYNAFWSDSGDTELTYYKDGYGFTSVTVNRTGKNLFNKNAVEQHTWIIVDNTETETRSNINYLTSDYIPVCANTRYYVSAKSSNRAAYYDRNKNGIAYFSFSGGASFNCLYDGYIRLTIKDDTDLDTFIVNKGSEAIPYEPFGISKTAKLHKVIYGGTADVIRGTCEPKNLIELYTRDSNAGVDYSINSDGSLHRSGTATSNSYNNGNANSYSACPYKLSAGTYTITVSGSTTPSDYVSFGIITKSGTSMSAQNVYGNSSKTFTINEDFGTWYWCKISSGVTVDDDIYISLEKGSTSSEYAPYFDPFSFPPISMETDEGENNLFANEGDSAITYRKAVD